MMSDMFGCKWKAWWCGSLLCAGVGLGCRAPDLEPFHAGTARIYGSVVEAREVYLDELGRIGPYVAETSELARESRRFESHWEARVAVLEAMVRYSGSLAELADAPGKARVQQLAESVRALGVTGGPYAAAIEGGLALLAEFEELAQKVAATHRIKRAVLATDDHMQELARLLARDFERLRRTLEENRGNIRNLMDGPLSDRLDVRAAVVSKVRARTIQLHRDLDGPGWADAVRSYLTEVSAAEEYLTLANEWYEPHRARVEAAERKMSARIELFRETELAIGQWGKAHGTLARSLQAGLTPDWTLLEQSAERMEATVRTVIDHEN